MTAEDENYIIIYKQNVQSLNERSQPTTPDLKHSYRALGFGITIKRDRVENIQIATPIE